MKTLTIGPGPWSAESPDQNKASFPGKVESSEPSPALTISLFPEYLSPTIHFPLHNEKCTYVCII